MPSGKFDRIVTEKVEVVKLEDRIVENIILESVHVDVDIVNLLKEANLKLMGDCKYCVLISSQFLASISKEARELAASKEFRKNTIAKALLISSIGHKIVGNFYLQVNKPVTKTRIFSDREKALEWLKEQLKENDAKLND